MFMHTKKAEQSAYIPYQLINLGYSLRFFIFNKSKTIITDKESKTPRIILNHPIGAVSNATFSGEYTIRKDAKIDAIDA